MTDWQRIKKVWKQYGKGSCSLKQWMKRVQTEMVYAKYLTSISPEVWVVVKKLNPLV